MEALIGTTIWQLVDRDHKFERPANDKFLDDAMAGHHDLLLCFESIQQATLPQRWPSAILSNPGAGWTT